METRKLIEIDKKPRSINCIIEKFEKIVLETEIERMDEFKNNLPANFDTEKWLKNAAQKSVDKISNSNYPEEALHIKLKPKWMVGREAISLYFRVPDLFPINTEEEVQNFDKYTADTVKLESISLHPYLRQRGFFKWFIFYLKRKNKFKFIHISSVVNAGWREYFKRKVATDPNYELATSINPKKLLPSCGDFEFIIYLKDK